MEKEDWFRKPRDEMMGEEVMVMPQMGAVTSAKPILPTNLNSTSYLNEAKANADADPSAPPHDSLRTFYYEGRVQIIKFINPFMNGSNILNQKRPKLRL